jgi:hypothetical protein
MGLNFVPVYPLLADQHAALAFLSAHDQRQAESAVRLI